MSYPDQCYLNCCINPSVKLCINPYGDPCCVPYGVPCGIPCGLPCGDPCGDPCRPCRDPCASAAHARRVRSRSGVRDPNIIGVPVKQALPPDDDSKTRRRVAVTTLKTSVRRIRVVVEKPSDNLRRRRSKSEGPSRDRVPKRFGRSSGRSPSVPPRRPSRRDDWRTRRPVSAPPSARSPTPAIRDGRRIASVGPKGSVPSGASTPRSPGTARGGRKKSTTRKTDDFSRFPRKRAPADGRRTRETSVGSRKPSPGGGRRTREPSVVSRKPSPGGGRTTREPSVGTRKPGRGDGRRTREPSVVGRQHESRDSRKTTKTAGPRKPNAAKRQSSASPPRGRSTSRTPSKTLQSDFRKRDLHSSKVPSGIGGTVVNRPAISAHTQRVDRPERPLRGSERPSTGRGRTKGSDTAGLRTSAAKGDRKPMPSESQRGRPTTGRGKSDAADPRTPRVKSPGARRSSTGRKKQEFPGTRSPTVTDVTKVSRKPPLGEYQRVRSPTGDLTKGPRKPQPPESHGRDRPDTGRERHTAPPGTKLRSTVDVPRGTLQPDKPRQGPERPGGVLERTPTGGPEGMKIGTPTSTDLIKKKIPPTEPRGRPPTARNRIPSSEHSGFEREKGSPGTIPDTGKVGPPTAVDTTKVSGKPPVPAPKGGRDRPKTGRERPSTTADVSRGSRKPSTDEPQRGRVSVHERSPPPDDIPTGYKRPQPREKRTSSTSRRPGTGADRSPPGESESRKPPPSEPSRDPDRSGKERPISPNSKIKRVKKKTGDRGDSLKPPSPSPSVVEKSLKTIEPSAGLKLFHPQLPRISFSADSLESVDVETDSDRGTRLGAGSSEEFSTIDLPAFATPSVLPKASSTYSYSMRQADFWKNVCSKPCRPSVHHADIPCPPSVHHADIPCRPWRSSDSIKNKPLSIETLYCQPYRSHPCWHFWY